MRSYSEAKLIEETAMRLLTELGWETIDAMHEKLGEDGTLGRASERDVILTRPLKTALRRLNPDMPTVGIDQAVEMLVQERTTMSLALANREVYLLLKNGVRVKIPDPDGEGETDAVVRVIDWETPGNNDFLAVQQLWVRGDLYRRRPDVVGFVNGLPLVLIELKAAHKKLRNAFDGNLRDYKVAIPQLFVPNAVVLLSNGLQGSIGTLTAGWEHFAEWKRVEREDEPPKVGLETLLRGTCEPGRLLDLVENFTLFNEVEGGVVKIIAKNHQFLGVNNAIQALAHVKENGGKLGVFWHTQGSGKSFSMAFFSQKVLRKVPGNWSFLVLTDRDDLDTQIYKTFARAAAVTEPEEAVRAQSGAHLKQLLREDHRYLFTLIQKFRTERGEAYPELTQRDDVIVMTDEAHRSQYDVFAANMRAALPNAAFIGFTGTPLMAGEEKTREVFGDYVSVYNFREAVEDGATVPLYYENRIPELQLTNDELQADMEAILEEAEVDEAQEKKLEREFSREYQIVTRDDRLEKIAQDLVQHFLGRGQFGKAMVVSIDKATAVRMYDKVQRNWQEEIDKTEAFLSHATGDERERLLARLRFLNETDMAVVISQSQNEIADFQEKGLDIVPHRRRMVTENLEEKFKKASDPLRIVFVCAMWMTGFDAPSVSSIYLDKPMRNHTLMQTIARANRVWGEKVNGLIVDYIGVFRNLQRALAIYGTGGGGDGGPIEGKDKLVAALRAYLQETRAYVTERGINPEAVMGANGFQKLQLIQDAVDALLESSDVTKRFLELARTVNRLYKAILPDKQAQEFAGERALYLVLSEKLSNDTGGVEAEIGEVMDKVEDLLDESVSAYQYVIRETPGRLDLSLVDFDKLAEKFKTAKHKRTEAEKLRAALSGQVGRLMRLNKTRTNYAERLQQMIDEYNLGSHNIDAFFEELVKLGRDLSEEAQRALREDLTEEELAVFDLLTTAESELTDTERSSVKGIARDLLTRLKTDRLVIDWRKKQQARARVLQAIQEELDRLPEQFSPAAYADACTSIYAHVYEAYRGEGEGIYA